MNVLLAATPYEFSHPLVTDRLRVRSMTTADIDDVTAYQSREDVCRYLLHGPRARDEVAAKVSEWSAATRLGMRHEAHFVQDLWFKGEWADTGVYGILAGEWLARSRGAGA